MKLRNGLVGGLLASLLVPGIAVGQEAIFYDDEWRPPAQCPETCDYPRMVMCTDSPAQTSKGYDPAWGKFLRYDEREIPFYDKPVDIVLERDPDGSAAREHGEHIVYIPRLDLAAGVKMEFTYTLGVPTGIDVDMLLDTDLDKKPDSAYDMRMNLVRAWRFFTRHLGTIIEEAETKESRSEVLGYFISELANRDIEKRLPTAEEKKEYEEWVGIAHEQLCR